MKHLKTFETTDYSKIDKEFVWIVQTKSPEYEISLTKIGMTNDEIKHWSKKKFLYDKICLIKSYYNQEYFWTFSNTTYIRNDNCDFISINKGEVKITDLDLNAHKYNL